VAATMRFPTAQEIHQVLHLWVMAWCGPLPTVEYMTVQADQERMERNS
jgi:hypothetical protein